MADRLPAHMIADLQSESPSTQQTMSAWISGSVTSTEVTQYVNEWGDPSEMELYNRHPAEPGKLAWIALEVQADNASGIFDVGNASGVFPNGVSDFSGVALLRIACDLTHGGESYRVWDYSGYLLVPEYMARSQVRLFAEHPLGAATTREWDYSDGTEDETGLYVNLNV